MRFNSRKRVKCIHSQIPLYPVWKPIAFLTPIDGFLKKGKQKGTKKIKNRKRESDRKKEKLDT